MQVITSNQHQPQGTRTSKAQGSRYAGNHFQQARTTRRHKPARHEVQGMQVITSNKHQPARQTNQQARGSRYAGNHFQPARQTNQQARGSRHAGNHFQQARTTRRHKPARHKVQGMQVTTSNQHTNHKAHEPHEPAGTRFKVCR